MTGGPGMTRQMGAGVVTAKTVLLAMAAALVLAGCEKREPILPGERENIREVLQSEARRAQAEETPVNRAAPISLPATASLMRACFFSALRSAFLSAFSLLEDLRCIVSLA